MIEYVGQERKEKFKYNDVTYDSPKDCCRFLNIDFSEVVHLVYTKNMSWEQAIAKVDNAREKKENEPLTYRGKTYSSLNNCCNILGLDYNLVRAYYIRNGCTKEDALDYYVRKEDNFKPVIFKHKTYKDSLEVCNMLKLEFQTVHNAMYYFECDLEEAVEHVLKYTRNPNADVDFRDKHYGSVEELCEAFNLLYIFLVEGAKKRYLTTALYAMIRIESEEQKRISETSEF